MEKNPYYQYYPRQPSEKKRWNLKKALYYNGKVTGTFETSRTITILSFSSDGVENLKYHERVAARNANTSYYQPKIII